MKLKAMALGAYQTNCYILWDEKSQHCVVIDPGYEPERVLDEVTRLGKTVEAVLLTHGHFDHVGGVRTLAAETDCRVYLCAQDLSMPPQMTAGPLYYTDLYQEGDVLELAGLKIRVIQTPGHTATAEMSCSVRLAISASGPRRRTDRLALMISAVIPSGTLIISMLLITTSLVLRPLNRTVTTTSETPVWLVTPSGRVMVYFSSLEVFSMSARLMEQTM